MSKSLDSTVKVTKKSAFSCDPCRRRKVKCGGERPSCGRCIARSENCVYKLPPTLSYTQTLENRVKELELLVSDLRNTSVTSSLKDSIEFDQSPQISPIPDKTTISKPVSQPPQNFEGLKLDDKGGITYHGATSFFQLPTPSAQDESPNSDPLEIAAGLEDGGSRRERLVNNAWQQRALETLSETPVRLQHTSISSS
jgi:hypothetical protein